MNKATLTATLLFALTIGACDKPAEPKVDEPSAKNTSTTNGTAAAAAAPTPVAIDEGVLSTPADFEETAEKAITAKTYKAELATLETEIAKD